MNYVSDKNIEQNQNTAVTLGKFDGLHLGHQKLINVMKEKAKVLGLRTIAFSFFPSPAAVLHNADIRNIYSRKERYDLIEEMGIDTFIEYPFDKNFAYLSPEEFMIGILHQKMKCKLLVVGEDYHFGKDKAGGLQILNSITQQCGIQLIIVPHVKFNNTRISSSLVRRLIVENDFDTVSSMMNRPYFIRGIVSSGKKIGRTIGFPTVNIDIPKEKLTPTNGVYVTNTVYKGENYRSISNVGYNPTVSGQEKKCETHIIGFNETIYGEEITVEFKKFLRAEKKFNNIEELKNQIEKDLKLALL